MRSATLRFSRVPGLVAFALAVCGSAWAQGPGEFGCGTARDLVVQALERAGPQGTPGDFADALQLLKRASAECAELGDAWYYRSLIEARLGHAPLAKFAADKARLVGSEALSQGLQPFTLATAPLMVASAGERGLKAGAASSATPAPVSNLQQKWALVIGVGSFADPNIPKLHYTLSDAQAFAEVLTDPAVGKFPKANVHTLTDRGATTQAIKEQLNWIARSAQPNDIVVIYLATHGSPRKLDSVGGLNYLLTYDTQIRSISQPDEDALYSTALPMVELSNAVATRMRALRTLVVLDTCYSGGAANNAARMMGPGIANAAPSAEALTRMSQGAGRIVLAASRVDQESLESDTLQHGYFTYFLLKSLRESKGMLPLSQVFASVQQQVSERVAADHRPGNVRQDPVMDRSSAEADFALGVPVLTAEKARAQSPALARGSR